MTNINPDDVILKFSDGDGNYHEVSLADILDGGIPIDDYGDDMNYIDTFLVGVE